MNITKIMGGVHLHVRTCSISEMAGPFLGKGWTDCAEIWCVVRNSPASLLECSWWVTAARATCAPLFRSSETAGRIALKFSMWLETH